MDLKSIGLLFILHLPWALKFIAGPFVDKHHLAKLGRRRSWIFPLQWVGGALLLGVANFPPETHFSAMYVLLLLLNITMATNDIAVDGYATDMLLPGERSWGNAIQAGARFGGMLFGGGLLLFLYDSIGWRSICIGLSAVVFLMSLPVVLHREIPPETAASGTPGGDKPGILAFLRRPEILRDLPILIAPTMFAFTSFQMRLPLLNDLGLSPSALGSAQMALGYPVGLVCTLLCGKVLERMGSRFFLRVFCLAVAVLGAACVYFANKGGVSMSTGTAILCLDNILIGCAQVWGYTRMMRMSAGPYSGTGFAVLSSLFILFPLAGAPLFGMIGDRLGFSGLYSLLAGLSFAGLLVAEYFPRGKYVSNNPAPPATMSPTRPKPRKNNRIPLQRTSPMNTPPHKPFSAGHAEQYDRKATEAEWLDPEIVFGLAYPFVAPGDSILDIGIGTGLSSALFSRAGLKVYGMDASKDMLDVCRKKNMAERLEVHDLRTPPYPFENTSINHAVCTGVMHLFASLDVIFAETARIMKKNGCVRLRGLPL